MKGYNGPLILCAVLLFGAVLVFPAFADMKEVEDAELARTNASVTGTPTKNLNCVEKNGICQDINQDYATPFSSPLESKVSDDFSLFPSLGPEKWTYNYGAIDPSHFGAPPLWSNSFKRRHPVTFFC